MEEQIARILIVEDGQSTRAALERLFKSPSDALVGAYAPPRFDVDSAENAQDAKDKMHERRRGNDTYDVVLVDLEIPLASDSASKSTEIGTELIQYIGRNEGANVGIMVNSNHDQYQELGNAPVVDFVLKAGGPHVEQRLFAGVVGLWKRVQQRREAEWAGVLERHLLQGRLTVALCQLSNDAGRRLDGPITALATSVAELTALVGNDAIKPDVVASIHSQCELVSTQFDLWQQEIGAQYNPLQGLDDQQLRCEKVVLQELHSLRSGISRKQIRVEVQLAGNENAEVDRETRFLIREWLIGAITDSAMKGCLKISVDLNPTTATLIWRLSDDATPLPTSVCDRISSSEIVGPEEGRAWGVSLASYFAEMRGLRFSVSPTVEGNIVTIGVGNVS